MDLMSDVCVCDIGRDTSSDSTYAGINERVNNKVSEWGRGYDHILRLRAFSQIPFDSLCAFEICLPCNSTVIRACFSSHDPQECQPRRHCKSRMTPSTTVSEQLVKQSERSI